MISVLHTTHLEGQVEQVVQAEHMDSKGSRWWCRGRCQSIHNVNQSSQSDHPSIYYQLQFMIYVSFHKPKQKPTGFYDCWVRSSQSVSLSLLSYSVTKAWFLTFVWQSDQVMIYDSLYCLTVWPRDGLSLLIVWQPDQVDCIHCLTVWPHDGLWLPIVWQSDQVMINDCFALSESAECMTAGQWLLMIAYLLTCF